MKIAAAFLLFSTVFAAPAWAEAPPRLHFLEQQLASISADNPGNLGFAALDLESGELVAIEGDNPFPMASTVKVAVAANYLAQVEHGRRSLDDRIAGRSARSLMEAMLIHSDNYATDLLLRDLGGPRTLQSWLTQVGVTGLRVDRNIAGLLRGPIAQELRDEETAARRHDELVSAQEPDIRGPLSQDDQLGDPRQQHAPGHGRTAEEDR